jgi:hypothetical protein
MKEFQNNLIPIINRVREKLCIPETENVIEVNIQDGKVYVLDMPSKDYKTFCEGYKICAVLPIIKKKVLHPRKISTFSRIYC